MSNGERRKDFWDKLEVIGKALIPVAVAIVGGLFSYTEEPVR